MKVLCVEETGYPASAHDPEIRVSRIVYRFDENLPPGRQRLEHSSSGMLQYAVPESSRALTARFENFVLNLQFAEQLLATRPDLVVIRGIHGCTVDLIRIADLLGVTVCCEFLNRPDTNALDRSALTLLNDALERADYLTGSMEYMEQFAELSARISGKWFVSYSRILRIASSQSRRSNWRARDYALYEFAMRDYPLLVEMQYPQVRHFKGCSRVLDLGCGAGIFLDQLHRAGFAARGIERDPAIADYARGMGLDVVTADVLEHLSDTKETYDGMYCSHFVEHLPFDAVNELFARIVPRLRPGGVLVMVFPDPESIRSQLLGFWRDPEHVRFYHPALVELLGRTHGLDSEWSSLQAYPHEVGPFSRVPPPLPERHVDEDESGRDYSAVQAATLWQRLLNKLGLVSRARHHQQLALLEQRIRRIEAERILERQQIANLAQRTDTLWRVNQTWAWRDDAVLRFRKPVGDQP